MLKYFLLLSINIFLFISPSIAFHTSCIEAVICDSLDKSAVAYAHIYDKSFSFTTVSNDSGKFNLCVQDIETELVFSVVGYQKKQIPFKQLLDKDTIFLSQASILLKNLIITDLTAKEVVRKAIAAREKNYKRNYRIEGKLLTAVMDENNMEKIKEHQVKYEIKHFNERPKISFLEDYLAKIKDSIIHFFEKTALLHLELSQGFLNISRIDSWEYAFVGLINHYDTECFFIQAEFISEGDNIKHAADLYISTTDFSILYINYNYRWKKLSNKVLDIEKDVFEEPLQWNGAFSYKKKDRLNILDSFECFKKVNYYDRTNQYLDTKYFVVKFNSEIER